MTQLFLKRDFKGSSMCVRNLSFLECFKQANPKSNEMVNVTWCYRIRLSAGGFDKWFV